MHLLQPVVELLLLRVVAVVKLLEVLEEDALVRQALPLLGPGLEKGVIAWITTQTERGTGVATVVGSGTLYLYLLGEHTQHCTFLLSLQRKTVSEESTQDFLG